MLLLSFVSIIALFASTFAMERYVNAIGRSIFRTMEYVAPEVMTGIGYSGGSLSPPTLKLKRLAEEVPGPLLTTRIVNVIESLVVGLAGK